MNSSYPNSQYGVEPVTLTLPLTYPPSTQPDSSNTFTDRDGDTFWAVRDGAPGEWETIELNMRFPGSDETDNTIAFYTEDAVKIIAMIAEAASPKPIPKTREEMAAFATAWDAKVEANNAAQALDILDAAGVKSADQFDALVAVQKLNTTGATK